MNPSKLFRRGGAALFALAFFVSISAARAQMAPGAGGYNSEFGTDYRVGMARRATAKSPIFVVGMRVRTTNGVPQTWIAPRFTAALSEKLGSVLGASAPQPQIGDALARRGLRFDEIGGGALNDAARKAAPPNALALRRALLGLQREYSPRLASRGGQARRDISENVPSLLALAGDITLSGSLKKPSTTITVSLHVAQLSEASQNAPATITLRAPSRDWAQLPARCVLALSDALPFPLSGEERTALLRSASPLTPAASAARLRYEQRVGAAIAEAQSAQLLFAQVKNAPAATSGKLRKDAAAIARRTQSSLRVLASAPPLPESDRAVGKEIADSARAWLAPLENIVRAETLKNAPPRKAR